MNTIQATTDHVFVSDQRANTIRQYTWHGHLLKTPVNAGTDHSEFCGGNLSGSDAFGDVLIAGNGHRRLNVLNASGTLQILPVNGIGLVPVCARIHKEKLYISLSSKRLQVFSVI